MNGQRKFQQSNDVFLRRDGFNVVDGSAVKRAESALRVAQWVVF
jgi:hypothetical protein